MDNTILNKLLEIQYLKGRLDELYKGYVPHSNSTNNRFVDSRISKYEQKLKNTDEIAFHLYQVENENRRFAKKRSKDTIKELLKLALDKPYDVKTKEKIQAQIDNY